MSEENERYAQLAAKLLSQSLPVSTYRGSAIDRDTIVASMVGIIEARSRAKRLLWAGSTLAVAACAALAIFVSTNRVTTPVQSSNDIPVVEKLLGQNHVLIREGVAQTLEKNTLFAIGDRLIIPKDHSFVLAFSDGTKADIAQESELEIGKLGSERRLSLKQGRLNLHVAKLGTKGRFQVITPDSAVEVHGTIFSVAVHNSMIRCNHQITTTQVQVSEGVVSVDHGGSRTYLHAGETWPCDTASSTATPNEDEPNPQAPSLPTIFKKSRSVKPIKIQAPQTEPERRSVTKLNLSNLEEQNDLFQEAMSAERQKDWDTAHRLINRLLQHYPGGPMEESALAERQKIIRELNRQTTPQ